MIVVDRRSFRKHAVLKQGYNGGKRQSIYRWKILCMNLRSWGCICSNNVYGLPTFADIRKQTHKVGIVSTAYLII